LIELITLLAIAAAIYMGWSLGSNDATNCIGTAVGGGILRLRTALILAGVFALIGAVVSGGQVITTFKEGVLPAGSITAQVAFVAAFSAATFVAVSTYLKIPVSTTHAIVGATLGIGLALSAAINWGTIGMMGIVWVTTPTAAMALGFIFYKSVERAMQRVKKPATANLIFKILVVGSGCYAAYSLGANNIGNVTGLIAGANITVPIVAAVIGGVAIMVGVLTWGGKVIETVGKSMTLIDPAMAFSAQLSTALVLNIFAIVGMPTSASHAVVGAVMGVGLVKGMSAINMKIVRNIFLTWILTPVVSAVLAFGIFKVIGLF
jgi:PiT family inorganic phosphate transporter